MKKTIAVLVGLVLLFGCGASASTKHANHAPAATNTQVWDGPTGDATAPNTPPPTDSSAAPFMLSSGTSALIYAESGADTFSARITVASIATTTRTVSPVPNTPSDNGQYVVADISIECVSQTSCYFDALDWDAVNTSGQGFSEAFGSKEPALGAGELAGRTVRGYLTIDAPSDVRELTYGGNSNPAASWRIR
jgi:hypothetical protein